MQTPLKIVTGLFGLRKRILKWCFLSDSTGFSGTVELIMHVYSTSPNEFFIYRTRNMVFYKRIGTVATVPVRRNKVRMQVVNVDGVAGCSGSTDFSILYSICQLPRRISLILILATSLKRVTSNTGEHKWTHKHTQLNHFGYIFCFI